MNKHRKRYTAGGGEGADPKTASPPHRSGFVAVVGRPNTGKSTLINTLARRKVAIVSDKPQTTRHAIRAVVTRPEAQVVFIDTPGFHKPHHRLGERLNQTVVRALGEVDAVLFLVDAEAGVGRGDQYLARQLAGLRTPVYVVVNKVDAVVAGRLAEEHGRAGQLIPDGQVREVSALIGTGLGELIEELIPLLPEGPQYYPEGMLSDQPERNVAAELIREQILSRTHEEVPHSVAVEVDEMSPRTGADLVDVEAIVWVERPSQKGIIIGHQGQMLKEIGSRAREQIEALLGSHIYLRLRVKVRKHWRKDEAFLKRLGY